MKGIFLFVSELSILWTFFSKTIVSSAVSNRKFNIFYGIHCTGHWWNPNPITCKLLRYGMICKVVGMSLQPCLILGVSTRKMNSCVSVSKHVSISGNLPCSFMQTILMDFTELLLERLMTAKKNGPCDV